MFNLNGINNIDVVKVKDKFYLIEINSRPGLSSNIILKKNQGPFIKDEKNLNTKFHATKIIYSSKNIIINEKIISFFKKIVLQIIFQSCQMKEMSLKLMNQYVYFILWQKQKSY